MDMIKSCCGITFIIDISSKVKTYAPEWFLIRVYLSNIWSQFILQKSGKF